MIVMRVSTRVVIVLALAAVLVGSGGRSGHASAPGPRSSPPLSAGCPAETVRNSALGVTLPLPPGWRDYGFNLSAPGGLFVADPAVHNGKGYPLGIGIGPLGTTSDHDDAHAAATAAERATHGIPFTVTRRPLTIGGAPAILLAPMPGQGPTVGIVLAHHGYLYWVIAFTNQDGDPLRPDQRQALASLRFIPHVGPFPTATVPPPNVPLPTPPSLSLAGAEGSRGAVTVRAWGTGYQPGEAVELQACWTGTPRPGLQPRYTWYWWTGVARATSRGLLDTTLTIPVNPAAYTTYSLRVATTDARLGHHLRTAVFRAPARSSPAARTSARRFSVMDDAGAPSSLTISGPIILWMDDSPRTQGAGHAARLRGTVLSTGHEFALATRGRPMSYVGELSSPPAIDGRTAVWVDCRHCALAAGLPGFATTKIYGDDLVSGREFAVSPLAGEQESPAISGHVVVWTQYLHGHRTIYGRDLTSGRQFPIAAGGGEVATPAISGHLVVWAALHDVQRGNWDIEARDLATGRRFPVAMHTAETALEQPRISGTRVVWTQYGPGSRISIRGKDLSSGRTFVVATLPAQGMTGPFGPATALSGALVVWDEARVGARPRVETVIYAQDLRTGHTVRVGAAAGGPALLAVSGPIVLWQTMRGGRSHINGALLVLH